MDSEDLLARENEFKKLNKQLEKKTEILMKEIEHVMQKQDIFSEFSGSLSSPLNRSTKKHSCETPKISTPERKSAGTPKKVSKSKKVDVKSFENGTERIDSNEDTDNNLRNCVTNVCEWCNLSSKKNDNMEFLYAFVSVNVKDNVLPQSFLKGRVTVENICKFLSAKVKLMEEQINKLQATIDKISKQCEGHMNQLAGLESERMALINKANNLRSESADIKAKYAAVTNRYNIENDTENLVKYRLVGGLLKLKPNVYRHKFECQKGAKTEREKEENEKQIEFYKNLLLKQEEPSTSSEPCSFQSEPEMLDCVKIESNETEDPLPEDITYTESVPNDHGKDNKNELVEEKDRLYKEQRSIADKLATEVKNLRCKNANLEARCASQEETIATLKQQVETEKQSEKEFRDATRNLSASHQKAICQLEAKVKCLTTRIDKQNALIDNLKKQNALLRTNGALKALEQDYNEFLNSE